MSCQPSMSQIKSNQAILLTKMSKRVNPPLQYHLVTQRIVKVKLVMIMIVDVTSKKTNKPRFPISKINLSQLLLIQNFQISERRSESAEAPCSSRGTP